MREKLNEILENKKVVAGIVLVILILISVLIKNIFLKDEMKIEENKTNTENVELLNGKETEEVMGEDGVIHIKDNKITFDIPKEIKDKIDYEKFKKEFSIFLDENKLMSENTTVTSDYQYYYDIRLKKVNFGVNINNLANTVVSVTYLDDNYSFSYV